MMIMELRSDIIRPEPAPNVGNSFLGGLQHETPDGVFTVAGNCGKR